MFTDIRHPDGSYEFRLHVPPDRLDPTTVAEALAVLRGLVRELEPFVEPTGAALRVLPIELSRGGSVPVRLQPVDSGPSAGAASRKEPAPESEGAARVPAAAAPPA